LNTATKIGIGVALVGTAILIANHASKVGDMAKKISFKIVDFGLPRIVSSVLSIPLTVRITNNTNKSLTIDSVKIIISYLSKQQFIQAGKADATSFTIVPGFTDKTFMAQVDLKALTKNIFDTLSTVLIGSKVTVKTDVTIAIAGVELPSQSFTKEIAI
jgi:hypothetical protein